MTDSLKNKLIQLNQYEEELMRAQKVADADLSGRIYSYTKAIRDFTKPQIEEKEICVEPIVRNSELDRVLGKAYATRGVAPPAELLKEKVPERKIETIIRYPFAKYISEDNVRQLRPRLRNMLRRVSEDIVDAANDLPNPPLIGISEIRGHMATLYENTPPNHLDGQTWLERLAKSDTLPPEARLATGGQTEAKVLDALKFKILNDWRLEGVAQVSEWFSRWGYLIDQNQAQQQGHAPVRRVRPQAAAARIVVEGEGKLLTRSEQDTIDVLRRLASKLPGVACTCSMLMSPFNVDAKLESGVSVDAAVLLGDHNEEFDANAYVAALHAVERRRQRIEELGLVREALSTLKEEILKYKNEAAKREQERRVLSRGSAPPEDRESLRDLLRTYRALEFVVRRLDLGGDSVDPTEPEEVIGRNGRLETRASKCMIGYLGGQRRPAEAWPKDHSGDAAGS